MSTERGSGRARVDEARGAALVWIDAAKAMIVRLEDREAPLERMESDVPGHHRATGHIRHDPGVRHGGGGPKQTAGEPHRIEHLKRFIDNVASRVPPTADLLVLGPGTVHEHLVRELSKADGRSGRHRTIVRQAAGPMTGPQLIARLRRFAGAEPRTRSVGAYRWSVPLTHRPSGRQVLVPHRVLVKAPRERGGAPSRGVGGRRGHERSSTEAGA